MSSAFNFVGIGDEKRSLRDARNLINEMFPNRTIIASSVERILDLTRVCTA